MKVLRHFTIFIAGCNLGYGAGLLFFQAWQRSSLHLALGIALLLIAPLAQDPNAG